MKKGRVGSVLGGAVRLSDCSQVAIEGIVMRDLEVWCCSLFGCHRYPA